MKFNYLINQNCVDLMNSMDEKIKERERKRAYRAKLSEDEKMQ